MATPGTNVLAGADLSAAARKFVKFDANGKVVLSGAGDAMAGILQNKPILDEPASVDMLNAPSKLDCDGTTPILVGDYLKSNAAGRGIKTAVDNDFVGARAMEALPSGTGVISVIVVTARRF